MKSFLLSPVQSLFFAILTVLLCLGVQVHGQAVIYANNSATTPEQTLTVYQGQGLSLTVSGITGSYAWVKNDAVTVATNGAFSPTSEGYYRVTAAGAQYSNYVYVTFMTATTGKNYAKLDRIRLAGVKSEEGINGLATNKLDQGITYSDGFGRAIQQITVKGAAQTGKDLVQPYAYKSLLKNTSN
jgi:hypothetical protein